MAQQIQTQGQETRSSQTGKSKDRAKRIWIVSVCIVVLLVIIYIVLSLLSITGHLPTIVAAISGIIATAVGILVGYLSLAPESKKEAEQDSISSLSSTSGQHISISGSEVYIHPFPSQPPSEPQPSTLPVSNDPSDIATRVLKQSSGSLFSHSVPTVPTNPDTIQQREEMVRKVYEQLTRPNISSVVLTGIGGQGKSTLAALVFNYSEAQRLSHSGPFQDASLWFDVGQDTTFSELASDILRTLDVSIPDFKTLLPRNQALALFNVLNAAEKSRLIVLNQFENFLEWGTGKAITTSSGVDDFVDALNSNPCTCRVSLTSRPRPAGTHSQLASCLMECKVGGLAIAEGVNLLRNQGVSTQQATDEDLREVVEHCDGHAFALVLLATLLRNSSLTVKALLNNPNYNQKWGANIAHQLLDDIVKRLAPIQRELLLAFSIYREAVPIDAARAIMTTKYENEQEQSALDELYNQHLLQSPDIPTQDEPCYQLHVIVADYAHMHFVVGNKQANEDALRNAHEKAAQYYVKLPHPEPDKRHGLEDVLPFVEAVRQFCQAGRWQQAYEISEDILFNNLHLWGEDVLLLELHKPLLDNGWEPTTQQFINIFITLGKAYNALGDKQKAVDYYEQALPLTQQIEDQGNEGTILNDLAIVYDALGDRQQALAYYEQALTLWRAVGDRKGEGTTLNNLGGVYDALGDKQKALDYYEQALTLRRAVGDRAGVGQTLNNLGFVYDNLGDKQKALDYYEQALNLRRAAGDKYGESTSLHNIGTLYFEQQSYKIALAHFYVAKNILVKIQSPDSSDEQSWINRLQRKVGEMQFAQLLAQVEPRAQQIVDEALGKPLT